MKPAARVDDVALTRSDAHGCPSCPHASMGPAIKGAPNVLVNNRSIVRIGDEGIHNQCCDSNTWRAETGSSSVFVNGRPVHRRGDVTFHCGGQGTMQTGSPNVFIGDGKHNNGRRTEDVGFNVYDVDRKPMANISIQIICPDGVIIRTKTNNEGKVRIKATTPGSYSIKFNDDEYLLDKLDDLDPLD